MKVTRQLLRKLYGSLLALYPQSYRDEYEEELRAVFSLSLVDAERNGKREIVKVVLNEFFSLPFAIFYEYLRERRKVSMLKKFVSYFEFTSGSWKEFLTAIFPFFLLGGILPLMNILSMSGLVPGPNVVTNSILFGLFGLLIILFLVGLKKGLPRWSLPYLGFLLSILSLYLFSAVFGTPIYLLFHDLRDKSLLFIDILWGGIYWYGLLFAMIVLVLTASLTSKLQRFKNDWTLLCFILYGAIPFALVLTFDEYAGEEPYILLAFSILALGAWSYLHSNSEWKRFGVLFGALLAVMFTVTLGKVILVPSQTWPINIDAGLVKSEAKSTIIMGMWFALGMLIPLAIKLFPHSNEHLQAA